MWSQAQPLNRNGNVQCNKMPYVPRCKISELAEAGYGIDDIMVKLELPKTDKWRRYVKMIVFRKQREGRAA